MNLDMSKVRQAAILLVHAEPISIEPDGEIWLGTDDDRKYLTAAQLKAVHEKAQSLTENTQTAAASARNKLKALG